MTHNRINISYHCNNHYHKLGEKDHSVRKTKPNQEHEKIKKNYL